MKIKELRQKSKMELQRMLVELREKLRDMRFKVAQRQLKKVRDIRVTKKTIARILTILEENKSKEAENLDSVQPLDKKIF